MNHPLAATVLLERVTEFAFSPARGKLNREPIALTRYADEVRELI